MPKQLRDILLDISTILKSGGIQNNFAESRALVAAVLDRPVNRIHPAIEQLLSAEQVDRILELAKRRCKGEPLQLLTGYTGFHNCILYCEPGVFIPRFETEVLVDCTLSFLDSFPQDKAAKVIDLGTGSGAIIIALAMTAPEHYYCAVDLSVKAIDLAEKNSELNRTTDRISFFTGNYFDPVRTWENTMFDLVISNPPYIKTGDIQSLEPEVKDWEPAIALDGGEDGLDHYRSIASELPGFFNQNAVALFEIAPEYSDPLEEIFEDNGFKITGIHKDLDGNDRVIEVRFK